MKWPQSPAVHRKRIIALILLIAIGINALAAGYSFISDPSGKGLGMSVAYLSHSPFSDYLLPGIVLFFCNGLLSLFTAVMVLRQSRYYAGLVEIQGLILCGWIIIQAMMVRDFNLLHLACLAAGFVLIRTGRRILHIRLSMEAQ